MASVSSSALRSGSAADMRCIAHLDMDCFYAQVEAVRLGIECRTTPFVCVQWGSFIAVNYPARALGIRRFRQTPDEMLKEHPTMQMGHVATYAMGELEYGYPAAPLINTHKVSLEPYRHASRQIFHILRSEPGVVVGKAGIDEAYIDVTEAARRELAGLRAGGADLTDALANVLAPSTRLIEDRRPEMAAWFAQRGTSLEAVFDAPMRALLRGECGRGVAGSRGFCVDAADADYAARCLLLCAASRVVLRLRQRIYAELHYDCSAGIAHNRVLAKCISATHKPNQQTLLLPDRTASALFELPLGEIRGFGGKFGAAVSAVCGGATNLRELWLAPMAQLSALDSSALPTGDDDDDDDEDGDGKLSRSTHAKATEEKVAKQGSPSVAEYTFYRIRGIHVDTVADPALPRAMEASKIFHPSCESWTAAQLWMAPLAGELWHRFRHYEDRYARDGRSLVVYVRTYVSPEDARFGARMQSYRRHTALPVVIHDGAALLAEMGQRELIKLMSDITNMDIKSTAVRFLFTSNVAPAENSERSRPEIEGKGEEGSNVPMPPLRIIGLSIIGLRPLAADESGNAAAAARDAPPQRSLKDMFASLAATTRDRVPTTSEQRGDKRARSQTDRELLSSPEVELIDGDDEDDANERQGSSGENPSARALSAAGSRPAVPQPAPQQQPQQLHRKTLEDFFSSRGRPTAPSGVLGKGPAAKMPPVVTGHEIKRDGADVADTQLLGHRVLSSVSVIEVSSGDDEEKGD